MPNPFFEQHRPAVRQAIVFYYMQTSLDGEKRSRTLSTVATRFLSCASSARFSDEPTAHRSATHNAGARFQHHRLA